MNRKILIIDDDPIVLFLHETILGDSAKGAAVLTFESGTLAQEYIIKHKSDELLLLLDINMPVVNGWQLLDFLSTVSFQSEIAVLMVTSSVNDSDKEKALSYPMVNGFLIKPLTPVALLALLDSERLRKFLE
ncbi:MAG: response regulator [Pedobacter sp.]|nr:MAG: response regulator [Pedobacter sp.]